MSNVSHEYTEELGRQIDELEAENERLREFSTWVGGIRRSALAECAKLVNEFDCHLAGYPNDEAKDYYESGVADTCNMLEERINALGAQPPAAASREAVLEAQGAIEQLEKQLAFERKKSEPNFLHAGSPLWRIDLLCEQHELYTKDELVGLIQKMIQEAGRPKERCPACGHTDLVYGRLVEPKCTNPWHTDAHLRTISPPLPQHSSAPIQSCSAVTEGIAKLGVQEVADAWAILESHGFPPEAVNWPQENIAGKLPVAIDNALTAIVGARDDLLAEVMRLRPQRSTQEATLAAQPLASPVETTCPGGIDPGFEDCPKCGASMEEECAYDRRERK